ncbi:MAG: hypothetical protein GKR90_23660 [Pseudomonadales bacterium]|nr:hypothetical protein [Pseudomonadales bacterium]
MRIVKIVGILFLVYVAIVGIFESLLGYYQPSPDGTLVITTTNTNGEQADRVLARLISDDKLYVAANHWPRAWFHQAQENPNVSVTVGTEINHHTAVAISPQEFDRVNSDHALPLVFRILTGFPPRYILRLDDRD